MSLFCRVFRKRAVFIRQGNNTFPGKPAAFCRIPAVADSESKWRLLKKTSKKFLNLITNDLTDSPDQNRKAGFDKNRNHKGNHKKKESLMKHSFWKIFFVTAIALSLGFSPVVSAEPVTVTGQIESMTIGTSTIVIDDGNLPYNPLTIEGFPFNKLAAQLEDILGIEGFSFELGDCLSVEYDLSPSGEFFKFVSLKQYCDCDEGVYECFCAETDFCAGDDDGIWAPSYSGYVGVGKKGKGQGQVHGKPPVIPPGHNR